MKIKEKYVTIISGLKQAEFAPLLLVRIMLAYGFLRSATTKWNDIDFIGKWMARLSIPAPFFSAWLVTCTETMGVIMLTIGFATRLISIPLIIILLVAMVTVHWANGFAAAKNGIEVPLHYTVMLILLIVFGPGRMSVDYKISRNWKGNSQFPGEETTLAESRDSSDLYCRAYEDF